MTTTVLVAESNAELREIYRKFLGGRGFNVRAAACGLECLAKLGQETPAVLVLDRALPWGGGDGVLAWLREEGLQGEVAVVLTSTTGAPRAAAEDTEVPVVTSLAKPFTFRINSTGLLVPVFCDVSATRCRFCLRFCWRCLLLM